MENNETELYHYGRKGMKWYQNIFSKGRVTGSGKRPMTPREKAKAAKERAKAKAKAAADEEARKHDPKRMTDQELQAAINRRMLENRYNELHPQKVSRGKKFVNDMIDKALLPGAIDAGKKFFTDALNKAGAKVLGDKKETDPMDKLRKEAEEWKLKAAIKTNKERVNGASDTKGKTGDSASDTGASTSNSSTDKVHTGTVLGTGTSRRTSGSSTKRSADYYDPIDTDGYTVSRETGMSTYRSNNWGSQAYSNTSSPAGRLLIEAGSSAVNTLMNRLSEDDD